MSPFNLPAAHSRAQLFNRAYLFLSLNWVVFFLTAWLSLLEIIPSPYRLSSALAIGLNPSNEAISGLMLMLLTVGLCVLIYYLNRQIQRNAYPLNLYAMLALAALFGWSTSPMMRYFVAAKLFHFIPLAFAGMVGIMLIMHLLSIFGPKLSINGSVFWALAVGLSLTAFIASLFQCDGLEILCSLLLIGVIGIWQAAFLQYLRQSELIYTDNLNQVAVQLATIIFSHSLNIFLRLLRLLIILNERSNRSKKR